MIHQHSTNDLYEVTNEWKACPLNTVSSQSYKYSENMGCFNVAPKPVWPETFIDGADASRTVVNAIHIIVTVMVN